MKESIEEARLRQEYLEGVLESAPDAIVTLDADGIVTGWNKGAKRLFGYTSEEAIGENIDTLVASEDPAIYKEAVGFSDLVSSKLPVEPIGTIRYRKDGTPLNVILSGSPVMVNGNFKGSVAVYTEITDRVKAEETLRASEERYRSFVQNFQGIAFRGKMDFSPIFFHGAVEKITGYTEDEFLIGKPRWKQIVHPDDMSILLPKNGSNLHVIPNYSYDREYRIVRKDGQVRWVHEVIQNTCDDKGMPVILQGAIYDITKRVEMETTLRESEERFRIIFEQAAVGVGQIKSKTGKFVRINQRYADILGYTVEEMGELSFQEITHPDDLQADLENMQRLLAGEIREFSMEKRYIHKDGSIVWGKLNISPMWELGEEPNFHIGVVEDITERKLAEQALHQNIQEMTFINSLGNKVGSSLSLNQVVQLALDGIVDLIKPDFALFSLRDKDKLNVQGVRYRDPKAKHKDTPMHKVGERLCGMSVNTEKALFSKNINNDPRCTWSECKEAGLTSFAALPLRGGGEIIGVLGLASATERDFEERETFLKTASYQISIGLQNAILYEKIKDHATKLEQEINERKEAETALQESERHYRLLAENATDFIWTMDLYLRFTYASPAVKKLLGYNIEDTMAQPLDEIMTHNSFEVVTKVLEEELIIDDIPDKDLFRSRTLELELKRKDGSIVWTETTVTFLRDSEDQPVEILGVTRDISERVRTQAALRESEQFLQNVFNAIMDGISILDTDLNVIKTNAWMEQMYIHQAPLEGRKCYQVYQQRQSPCDWCPSLRTIETGETTIEIVPYPSVENPTGWIELSAFPVKNDQGNVINIIEYVKDISERKLAEKEIRGYTKRIESLREIEKAITSSLDLDEVLSIIMTELAKVIPYDSISLQILQDSSLEIFACRGFKHPSDVLGLVFPLDPKYPNHQVIDKKEALAIEDISQAYPHFRHQSNIYNSGQIRSWLGVPLIYKGVEKGLIAFGRFEVIPFSEDEINLASTIASQAALAIENASLFSGAQRRLERLSSLRRIDEVIASKLDLRVTLNIILGQILQQLEVDAAAILLYQPNLQSLEFITGQGFHTQAMQFSNLRLGEGFAGRAALEKRILKISDLNQLHTGFLRSPDFRKEGFVAYIGAPLITKGMVSGVLEVYHRRPLDPDREWLTFLETLAGQAAIAIDSIRMFEDLQSSNMQLHQAYDATIEGWAQALEMRDMGTEGHSRRVVETTLKLARVLNVKEDKLIHIRRGAQLHDIGKMGVPDTILQKPEKLNEREWQIMRQHPQFAFDWLSSIDYLRSALDIPYCHHEKWDGTGYPRGLKGKEIPVAARIFAVVDVWDALRSDRPYRKAWNEEKVIKYLEAEKDKHFDPKVVDAFLSMIAHK
jgi:PAS domain S-box-containing protein